jgi:hypothetical protein
MHAHSKRSQVKQIDPSSSSLPTSIMSFIVCRVLVSFEVFSRRARTSDKLWLSLFSGGLLHQRKGAREAAAAAPVGQCAHFRFFVFFWLLAADIIGRRSGRKCMPFAKSQGSIPGQPSKTHHHAQQRAVGRAG